MKLAQYGILSRRAIVNMLRQPVAIVPPLAFPLLFLALNSAALDRSTTLPGFPEVDSFLQFALPATITQGAMFLAVGTGSEMAGDVERGFFDRLVASPAPRTSILVSRVSSALVLGFLQAWVFMGITRLFGADVEGGPAAMLLIAIVAAVFAAGISAISSAFGLKTGSTEAVQGSFPALFALMFLSSAFFPRTLMDGWFESVASANPLSHLIEGVRVQIIDGLDLQRALTSLAIASAIFVLGVVASGIALRGRLRRGS